MSSSFPDLPDASFLATHSVRVLLCTHPNDFGPVLCPPTPWVDLVRQYASPEPPELEIISHTRAMQLPRNPICIDEPLCLPSEQGMSPKKIHEVTRMVTYIARIIAANNLPSDVRIVDVGAGQGYLTRALKHHLPKAHILALDADAEQTRGAQKWEQRLLPNAAPQIAHKTVLITPRNLVRVVDEWVGEDEPTQLNPSPVLLVALHACGSLTPDVLRAYLVSVHDPSSSAWTPAGVVTVGCCYNLMTPGDFPLSQAYRAHEPLLNLPSSAFHLAAQIPSEWLLPPQSDAPDAPRKPLPSVELAVRKVTWRALLGRVLQTATPVEVSSSTSQSAHAPSPHPTKRTGTATVPAHWPRRPENWEHDATQSPASKPAQEPNADSDRTLGTGQTPTLVRLGKLPASAYASWAAFLCAVEQRLGVSFPEEAFRIPVDRESESRDGDREKERDDENEREHEMEEDWRHLQRQLGTLHVLRCLLGPVVESVILRDQVRWVREELGLTVSPQEGVASGGEIREREADREDHPEVRVELVNLFDQATGSGRNVAIVIAGTLPDFGSVG